MKVLLINPRLMDNPIHPLGILYIAANLEKNGFEVNVIDLDFEDPVEKIVKEGLLFKPDIVGITVTTPQINKAFKIASSLKKVAHLPIIFGGIHTIALPNEVLKKEFVDYVVIGEGEETFVELCQRIKKKGSVEGVEGVGYKLKNKLKYNKPRKLIENLDKIPFPARHLLSSRWYFAPPRIRGIWTKSIATVMATRGCPSQCIYCGSHLIFGRKVRYRSVDNVLEEIKHLKKDFNIDSLWFPDDNLTVNHKWVKEFCYKLRKLKWKKFKWSCQARVNTVDFEILNIMKKAGCVQVDFGVESGSLNVLKILKKGITPEQIIKAFDATKKAGINSFAGFMIGTPGETNEDIILTEKLVKRIKPGYTDFFFTTPFPGTELYDTALKHNYVNKQILFEKYLCTHHTDKPIMCANLSEKELIKWRTRLCNLVFFRNYKNYIKDLRFILGAFQIIFIGRKGIFNGLRRFIETKKVDSIFLELLKKYRNVTKKESQIGH